MSKERLNLSISSRTKARIDELTQLTDAGSAAEVIKNALMNYEAMAKRVDAGETFYVERNGTYLPIDLMIDVPGRKITPPSLHVVDSESNSPTENEAA